MTTATDTETYTICEGCHEPVRAGDPGIVLAYEQRDTTTFGGPKETTDGMGVLFHESHFPHGSPAYRLA